jgi:hypothetical protein
VEGKALLISATEVQADGGVTADEASFTATDRLTTTMHGQFHELQMEGGIGGLHLNQGTDLVVTGEGVGDKDVTQATAVFRSNGGDFEQAGLVRVLRGAALVQATGVTFSHNSETRVEGELCTEAGVGGITIAEQARIAVQGPDAAQPAAVFKSAGGGFRQEGSVQVSQGGEVIVASDIDLGTQSETTVAGGVFAEAQGAFRSEGRVSAEMMGVKAGRSVEFGGETTIRGAGGDAPNAGLLQVQAPEVTMGGHVVTEKEVRGSCGIREERWSPACSAISMMMIISDDGR